MAMRSLAMLLIIHHYDDTVLWPYSRYLGETEGSSGCFFLLRTQSGCPAEFVNTFRANVWDEMHLVYHWETLDGWFVRAWIRSIGWSRVVPARRPSYNCRRRFRSFPSITILELSRTFSRSTTRNTRNRTALARSRWNAQVCECVRSQEKSNGLRRSSLPRLRCIESSREFRGKKFSDTLISWLFVQPTNQLSWLLTHWLFN